MRTAAASSCGRFPLDDDVIDRVLRCLSDHGSLQSAILTCKSVYEVFQAHPKSILRAVARNITGSTLPQALTLVRSQLSPDQVDRRTAVADVIKVDETTVITLDEVMLLKANADVVWELEDLFSLRYTVRHHRSFLSTEQN
jgi:hypothetical protein